MTFRRYFLDKVLSKLTFHGKVIDIGGKKVKKRGCFSPDLSDVDLWVDINIDLSSKPDLLCDATELAIEDNSCDIVLMTEVLEHLEKPLLVLSEINRILKPGGKLYATSPFLYSIHADPFDFQRWTKEKYRCVLEELKFHKIEIQEQGGFWAVIFDLCYARIFRCGKMTFRKKIIYKILLMLKSKFLMMDEMNRNVSKIINTGYFVKAQKSV